MNLLRVGLLLFWPSAALVAGPITFTLTGTASGTAGSTSFTNALFALTEITDTDLITHPGAFYNAPAQTGVLLMIAGIGSGTFTSSKEFSEKTNTGGLFFRDPAIGPDLLDVQNPAFATYHLDTPLGPLAVGNPTGLQFTNSASNLGTITITSATNLTFTATTPEPTTVWLFAIGLAGTWVQRYRTRRR